jgi:MFS family permease
VAIFTVTSGLAALVQNTEWLIIARAAQGIGAALIMPLSLSLISAAFPPEQRGRALGIWSAVSVSGLAFGPIVGGVIVEYFAWQWIFLINVPIGIAAFVVTTTVVRESRDQSGEVATDIPGTITITGAIAALTWSLIEAGERGWGDSMILMGFVISAVLFAAFVFIEQRTERPMVPLGFFKSRHVYRSEHRRFCGVLLYFRNRLLDDDVLAAHSWLLGDQNRPHHVADGDHDDGPLADLWSANQSHRDQSADYGRDAHHRGFGLPVSTHRR